MRRNCLPPARFGSRCCRSGLSTSSLRFRGIVPMLQTSAIHRMSGGRIRDHRVAVLHDPEGPQSDPSYTDADHRQDPSQSVQEPLGVSQDSPSTGTSMSLVITQRQVPCDPSGLRPSARCGFISWNRAARNWTMPVFNQSETPRHRTQQQAPVDQTGLGRVPATKRSYTSKSPESNDAETRIRWTAERVCEL